MSTSVSEEKIQMVRSILPDTVKDVHFVRIDLDISDLSIADILRNVNTIFPKNSRDRNRIVNGEMVAAILCKTELLKPLDGLIIIICDDGGKIDIKSKNFVVLAISESIISESDKISDTLDRLTTYLIHNYGEIIHSFKDFYVKFIYDDYELDDED